MRQSPYIVGRGAESASDSTDIGTQIQRSLFVSCSFRNTRESLENSRAVVVRGRVIRIGHVQYIGGGGVETGSDEVI